MAPAPAAGDRRHASDSPARVDENLDEAEVRRGTTTRSMSSSAREHPWRDRQPDCPGAARSKTATFLACSTAARGTAKFSWHTTFSDCNRFLFLRLLWRC